ncbi:TetR/AcrR family transcriptional regulator [Caulobacter mirabilis]|uniref:TetR family transcriptional regulator n=1 Tax=Caulobacter mirabilis TaxID=69666 RepID=A0A2D2AW44_9CAUL|nr:TetR/AcrR family transcriptional regulator [Caulobacter mirabilis]ATQ42229.1 TetR family transcriptional regulator [Caulobacter mirabilis]
MKDAAPTDNRPYHHGDLRRALVEAARRILENEGPSALSLRAVAREAGVSPAAPYHHFKDKGELLDAVAHVGWDMLGDEMRASRAAAVDDRQAMTEIGVAYVRFAQKHPALYRVMYDCSRDKVALPEGLKGEDSAYCMVQDAFRKAAGPEVSEMDVELATIAAWCAAHGLAEMSAFHQFDPLREALGSEDNFLRAVLSHMGMFPHPHPGC